MRVSRISAASFIALAVTGATLASPPGQPLDCSDWVVLEPGLACSGIIPPGHSTRTPFTATRARLSQQTMRAAMTPFETGVSGMFTTP